MNDLLDALKSLFVEIFQPFLTTFVASLHAMNTAKVVSGQVASWNFAKAFDGWDSVFDKVLRGLEDKSAQVWQSLVHGLFCFIMVLGPKITPANHCQGNYSSLR